MYVISYPATVDSLPMTNAHRTVLRKNHTRLYKEMILVELIEVLYQKEVVLDYDKERLHAEKTRTDRAILLLHILRDKRDECFGLFVKALCQTQQCHLANILMPNFCKCVHGH